MIYSIYCVKDRATDAFGTPMFLIANAQAIRTFSDEVNRAGEDNQLFNHPDDFDLYFLGRFDSEAGAFDCHAPEVLIRGKDISTKFRNAETH